MRRLLSLVGCTAALLAVACSKHVIVNQQPAPDGAEQTPTGEVAPTLVDLGTVESGVDVPFEIPKGALGFNVVIEGRAADFDGNAPYGIERLTDPNGKVVHDNFTPNGGTEVTSTAVFDTIATVSIPQGEGTSAEPGTWTLRVGVQNSTKKVKVTAKVRIQSSGDGTFHGGTLDLHVHVPDGLKVGKSTIASGSTAQDSPELKQRIDTFYKLVSQMLGIDRGTVVFHSAEASLAAIDGDSGLIKGFAASRGATDGSQELHVLFTNSISLDGKPVAAGISPGVPGAAGIFGRAVSTIIVSPSQAFHADASSLVQSDVLTMIHETGHFFGLNHTTEFGNAGADPLADTPRCTTLTGEPNFAQLKTCPDRTNIMFPATAIEAPAVLSPEQKAIYRGSPVYKAYSAAAAPMTTRSLEPIEPLVLRRQIRVSDAAVSPVEAELALGFCGLNKLDPEGMVRRYGEAETIAQLRVAEADDDLDPVIRGRASLALDRLNAH
jgi:hypothetical protein